MARQRGELSSGIVAGCTQRTMKTATEPKQGDIKQDTHFQAQRADQLKRQRICRKASKSSL